MRAAVAVVCDADPQDPVAVILDGIGPNVHDGDVRTLRPAFVRASETT